MSDITAIAVPKWGIEMIEGTVVAWIIEEGAVIAKGDELFEMESDKIINVWESPVDGVLRRQLAEEGDTKLVGDLLGVIAAAHVDDDAIDAFIANFGNAAQPPAQQQAEPAAPAKAAAIAPGGNSQQKTNPVVRRLAEELGVDLSGINGTGRNGRITQEDVQAAASSGATDTSPDTAASEAVDIIPLSATRKTIGKRLVEAKQSIPHFYLTVDYELDGLLAHRKQLNETGDTKVSVNDLIVWCVSRALMQEPRVNVNLVGDDIHQFKHANVSVAIATEDGLYPATLREVDNMTPAEIATATAALADKARTGKLSREDISGGSFTVSNLGMYGVASFTAIVNPPMGAILALGKGESRVVVKDGAPAVSTVITATLSCDHRVIDGAVGAQFLAALGEQLEQLGS